MYNNHAIKKKELRFKVHLKSLSLLFLILLPALSSLSTSSAQQSTKFSLTLQSTTIKGVCKEIEHKSDYVFVFSDNTGDAINQRVNVNVNTNEITDVLNNVFAGSNLGYQIIDKQVAVYQVPARAQAAPQAPTQNSQIIANGHVSDEYGEPLTGVSIMLKGTTSGTITDYNGDFSFTIPLNGTVVVNYVGFVQQELVVRSNQALHIVLLEDVKKLEEVVVIGYGTRQRKSITGSVDQVGSEMFQDRPVSTAMQALQGASPNLIIQQKNANPNDISMNINIRGISTMGNNDPLVVVDGLVSSANALQLLNPNDIENVSVLKDAGSAAIYGSRSANGVILVTTKKGSKSLKPTVKLNGLTGYENPHILYQPVEGWQNAMYRNQANMNVGSASIFTPEQIRDLYDHRHEEYWYLNEIMQKGLKQNYNLSVSGGGQNNTYMVSLGYLNHENNYIGDFGMKRYNFRSNMTTEYGRFKLTSLLAYTRKGERTPAGGTGNLIINSSRIPPYYYYQFTKDGKYLINDVIGDDNTMAKLLDGGYEDKDEDNVIGSINLDVQIIDGLTAKGLLGLDLTQHHRYRRDIQVPLYAAADLDNPVLYLNSKRMTEDYNNKRHTLSTQFMLDYDKQFDSHHISGLLGVSNESYTFKASRIAWEYTDEDLGLPTTDDALQNKDNKNSNADTDQTSITSVFGRISYNYLDKYYGDVSFRYDGSSKFDKDYRWGFFPSVSAAWRLTEEDFLDAYKTNVGDLKLRTSYGVLGNQNVDNYSYQTVYEMYTNIYVFNNLAVPGTGYTYGNPFLTWEKSANFNIGVDASFFNNSLFVAFDYFNKRTWDILLAPEVSSVFGSSAARENAGVMQNQGWELTVNYRLRAGDFRHNFNLNLSDTKNKVVDFGGKERIDQSDQMYKLIREGEALGSYYGYKTDGVFQSYQEIAESALPVGATVQPGDVKYVDAVKDGVIDDKDRVVLGNAFPRLTFGFTYEVAYRGFDFSALLQGVGKRHMYVRGELIEPFHSNYSYAIYQHQLDFWTPTNPDAQWPRLVAPGSPSSMNNWGKAGTDIYLLNGAYLRVKDLQLGYTLPKAITLKAGIQKCRISLNTQNLLTLSKNSFVDPETSEFGNNMGGTGGTNANSARNYPTLEYYGVGLDIEF